MMQLEEKIKVARQAATVAGVFLALVSLLLILNYMQIRASDPLESQALNALVERLSADPGNHELMDEIRQLDLLARKAYFTSLWQIRTGAWLLVIGAVVLVIALRWLYTLKFSIDRPAEETVKAGKARLLSQRWIAASGAVVVILAALSAFFTADHIRLFESQVAAAAEESQIEQIEVGRTSISAGGLRGEGEQGGVGLDEDMAEGASPAGDGTAGADPASEGAETGTGAETASSDAGAASGTDDAAARSATQPAAAALTEAAIQQHHNAFRGPMSNGISPHRNIPTAWDGSSGNNILWKTEIPLHGYNSPVIWGDKLFFSGADDSRRMVYCYDRHTGNKVWEKQVTGIPGSPATPPRTTDDTGLAAPSLTVDGQRVMALFGTGDIIAFDLAGNQLWARNLGVPSNHYGHSSSLVTWNKKVFVQYDTQSGSRVMALNVENGETVWETPRTNGVSWASPILANVDGKHVLILLANPDLSAYDIETGRQLWSVNCMSGEVGPSPAYGGGLVYAANEYAKMVGVNPKTGEQVWQDNYYLPEVASLLYHDGLVYVATTFAVLAAFEASSGEFLWEFDSDDGFYSSPVIADNKLYIFDTGGKAYIFRPGREADLITTSELGERVFATPVFAEGRMYIRGNKYLYCIGSN
jgi:outer membrane protein assembly factor BamB